MNKHDFSVEKMCRIFKISSGSYYNWVKNPQGKVHQRQEPIKQKIKELFFGFKGRYGSPRMTVELNSRGIKISKPTVAILMETMNLVAKRKRRFMATTNSKHHYRIVPNKLDRNFNVSRKNEVWVSDITYVRTTEGWLYLTVILDLFDRKVVGWAMSKTLLTDETIVPAWLMATINRPVDEKLLFHSDRGIQYACDEFTRLLNDHKLVKRSMSRKGNCWDNAVAESFFKTLKAEEVYGKTYLNKQEAEMAIFEYIEGFYNQHRRHSVLGNLTIKEFENLINAA